jgi:hypothetical protein
MISFAWQPNVICSTAIPTTTEEKSLLIIRDVLDIKSDQNTIELTRYNSGFMGNVEEENTKYTLINSHEQGRVSIDFKNGMLFLCMVQSEYISVIASHNSGKTLDAAKGIIQRYQAFLGDSSLGEMINVLNEVNTVSNATLRDGNIKLEVKLAPSFTSFHWKHVFNDVEYNEINIVFSSNSLSIADFGSRYKMGNTDVKISKEQAIDIATNYIENYGYPGVIGNKNGTETRYWISGFNISLERTIAKLETSDKNNLVYPCWDIDIMLGELYPGNVVGFGVLIWADTGEVFSIAHQAVGTSSTPNIPPTNYPTIYEPTNTPTATSETKYGESSDTTFIASIAIAVAFIAVIASTILYKRRSK